jgi:hypothetical protein
MIRDHRGIPLEPGQDIVFIPPGPLIDGKIESITPVLEPIPGLPPGAHPVRIVVKSEFIFTTIETRMKPVFVVPKKEGERNLIQEA